MRWYFRTKPLGCAKICKLVRKIAMSTKEQVSESTLVDEQTLKQNEN